MGKLIVSGEEVRDRVKFLNEFIANPEMDSDLVMVAIDELRRIQDSLCPYCGEANEPRVLCCTGKFMEVRDE